MTFGALLPTAVFVLPVRAEASDYGYVAVDMLAPDS